MSHNLCFQSLSPCAPCALFASELSSSLIFQVHPLPLLTFFLLSSVTFPCSYALTHLILTATVWGMYYNYSTLQWSKPRGRVVKKFDRSQSNWFKHRQSTSGVTVSQPLNFGLPCLWEIDKDWSTPLIQLKSNLFLTKYIHSSSPQKNPIMFLPLGI
jgi:hypothetical protein